LPLKLEGKYMKKAFYLMALVAVSSLPQLPAEAADEDGHCLRVAEEHCAAILTTYGEAQYRVCVARRIQSCLRSGSFRSDLELQEETH
jgi:hypothetical protein